MSRDLLLGYEIPLPEPNSLNAETTQALGILAAAAGSLIEYSGAEERVAFKFAGEEHTPSFPHIPGNPPRFLAERQDEATWYVAAYLAKPLSDPLNVTMNNVAFSLTDTLQGSKAHFAMMRRDYYIWREKQTLRGHGPKMPALTLQAFLRAMNPAMMALGHAFDERPEDWRIK